MVTAENELSDLELLERAASTRPGANQNIYDKVSLSLNNVEEPGTFPLFPEGDHPFKVVAVEECVGKPKEDEFGGKKPGTPYVLVKLECIEGPCAGWDIEDRLMLEGKGLSRLKMFIKCLGLLDEDMGNFHGCWADFLNKKVWANIVTEPPNNPKFSPRSKVAFAGYTAYEALQFEEEVLVQEEPPVKKGGTPPWKQ